MKIVKGLAFGLSLLAATAASAAGISPPNYPFKLTGGGNLVNGGSFWSCQWSLDMQTGTSIGGSPARASGGSLQGGTGTTNANCNQLTISASTFTITSATGTGGTGYVSTLIFLYNGGMYCYGSNVPFTYTNNPNGTSTWFFNSATVGSCNFNANLQVVAKASVVP